MNFSYLVPLNYFLSSRASTWRNKAGTVLSDFSPIALALLLVHHVDLSLSVAAYAGFTAVYEIGHLHNDSVTSSQEPGGLRIARLAPPLWLFSIPRLLFAGAVALWIANRTSPSSGAVFFGSSLLILALCLLHTRLGLLAHRWPRLLSFSVLAIYRYAPWTLPFIPFRSDMTILTGTFLFFGLSRIAVYVSRKLDLEDQLPPARDIHVAIQAGSLILFLPLVVITGWGDMSCLWAVHGFTVLLSGASRLVRRMRPKAASGLVSHSETKDAESKGSEFR